MFERIKTLIWTAQVKRLLSKRLPEGKRYAKREKLKELLPEAVALRLKGYDFIVDYQAKEGHYERVKDGVVNTESVGDGQEFSGYGGTFTTLYFASGKTFTYHSQEELDPDFKIPESDYDKWVIDRSEAVSIRKGPRL